MSCEEYAEPLNELLDRQPYSVCKIHTRNKNRIWFHDAEECSDIFLKKYEFVQPAGNDECTVDDYYEPLCGYIYIYNTSSDIYECNNQILTNTGGIVWNLYIKIYEKVGAK